MCFCAQGLIRAASGTTFGVPGTRNLKENKRFYGFTDFRGKPARRGRGRHAPANQVTAGMNGVTVRLALEASTSATMAGSDLRSEDARD